MYSFATYETLLLSHMLPDKLAGQMRARFLLRALGLLVLMAACGEAALMPPAPSDTPTPATETTPLPPNVCQPNPDPASPQVLVIDTPKPGDAVTSPLLVSGRVAAFEATFKITIFNAAGQAIADVVGMSAEGQVLSPFSEQITFSTPGPKPACLWVYQASARDGSPIHVGQVPILLLP